MNKRFKIAVAVSLVLLIAGAIFALTSGFNWGTDFKGGAVLSMDMTDDFNIADIEGILDAQGIGYSPVQKMGTPRLYRLFVTMEDNGDISALEAKKDSIIESITEKYPLAKFMYFERIAARYNASLVTDALPIAAICAVVVFIYVWLRQRLKSALMAVFIPLYNVLLLLAATALFGLKINIMYFYAVLALLAYSLIHTLLITGAKAFYKADKSKRQSELEAKLTTRGMSARITLLTGALVFAALCVMMIIGTSALKEFALALLVGVLISTCISMFVTTLLALKEKEA